MTASLPMYLRPETQGATDRLWQAIHRVCGIGPDALIVPDDLMSHWRDPELVLSQTCGLPYRAHLHGQVDLVATPDYALPGCPPGHYNSVLIARAEYQQTTPFDWADMRFAINGADSQSGWAAPQEHLAQYARSFSNVVISGAHINSARMVAEGDADIAAVDAQTWRLLKRYDSFAGDLVELTRTTPTPGLPLITARGRGDQMRDAVHTALTQISAANRDTLDLRGMVQIPARAYTALPLPSAPPS